MEEEEELIECGTIVNKPKHRDPFVDYDGFPFVW